MLYLILFFDLILVTSAFPISEEDAKKIFEYTTKEKPFFALYIKSNDIEYIVGVTNSETNDDQNHDNSGYVYKLTKVGKLWSINEKIYVDNEIDEEFPEDEGEKGILAYHIYNNPHQDIVSINDNIYIYFEGLIGRKGSMWNNAFIYHQYLFDINTNKIYKLKLEGWGDDDPEYVNLKDFKDNTEMIKIFNEKSSKSEVVSKFVSSNPDINVPANFVRKFKIENKQLLKDVYDEGSYDIKFVEYNKGEIFNLFKADEFDLSEEDENYKISTHGLYLICYDKKNKKDIVLFAQPQAHNCLNCQATILGIYRDNVYVKWGFSEFYSNFYIINIKNNKINTVGEGEFVYKMLTKDF